MSEENLGAIQSHCAESPSALERDADRLIDATTAEHFSGALAPSLYETLAVIACLHSTRGFGEWSESSIRSALSDVIAKQSPEGWWGSDPRVPFLPDRVITTLAALDAADVHGMLPDAVFQRARQFLVQFAVPSLDSRENKKPIAYDALTAELLVRLATRGRPILGQDQLAGIAARCRSAIEGKIPLLLGAPGTIHSSLDALGSTDVDWHAVARFQGEDGSMGSYPSSTAALLRNVPAGSQPALGALRYLAGAMNDRGEVPPFFPSEEFERWWVLLALAQSPLRERCLVPGIDAGGVPPQGLAVSSRFALPDVDTAAMKAATLLSLGYSVSLDFLDRFHVDGVFVCYENERRTSPSANIHAAMAIALAPLQHYTAERARMLANSLSPVVQAIEEDGFVEDKWHLSDIYSTAHAIELFIILASMSNPIPGMRGKHLKELMITCIKYVLSLHHDDGGFGIGVSTVEESGYALRALCMARISGLCDIPDMALVAAGRFLEGASEESDPPLWMGKTLYRSPLIAGAQRVSARAWLSATGIRPRE
ncbi:hypothetical protein [Streptomyces sp. NPDC056480]|uniref:hypothetical protein n=1 Tax=Streptomyces sp. NPDC056480 TaxID=3345833 RepID=UPI0036AD472F